MTGNVGTPEWWGVSPYLSSQLRVSVEREPSGFQVRLLSPTTGTVSLPPDVALRLAGYATGNSSASGVSSSLHGLGVLDAWTLSDGVLVVWEDALGSRGAWSGVPLDPEFPWGRLTANFLTTDEWRDFNYDQYVSEPGPPQGGIATGAAGYVPLWNTRTLEGESSLPPKSVVAAISFLAHYARELNNLSEQNATDAEVQARMQAVPALLSQVLPAPIGDRDFDWEPRWQPGAGIP